MTERKHNLKILRNAMVPHTAEDGTPLHIGPYQPVRDACEICPARCCRFTVKVSIPDALRFCSILGLPFFAGLTLAPGGGPRSFEIEHDRRINPDVEMWPGTADIVLRRADDGSCGMLISVGGHDRCGAYAARPSTCRLYPVTWTSDVAEGGPPLLACPVPYALTPSLQETFFEHALDSIDRWALHDRIIAAWHEQDVEGGRTTQAFLHFSMTMAAEELGVDLGRILDVGGPLERLQQAMIDSGIIRLP